jgi:uncharacterized membrane protein
MQFPERDPKFYKWKMFYYNPGDDRLIVPKPNPNLGITLNFAKPKAYLILLPMILFPAALITIINVFGK